MSWITNNLHKRATNPLVDFKIKFHMKPFRKMDFHTAVCQTAISLSSSAFRPIHLAYSGGIDSEFLLRLFHSLQLPIVPIIVKNEHNMFEYEFACHTVKQLGIDYIDFEASDNVLRSVFNNKIAKPFNGDGTGCTPTIISAMIAEQRNAICITGDSFFSDHDRGAGVPIIANEIDVCEYNVYHEVLYPNNAISFFLSSSTIAYPMVKAMDGSPMPEFKARLYGLDYRPKARHRLQGIVIPPMANITRIVYPGTPTEFCKKLEQWIIPEAQ